MKPSASTPILKLPRERTRVVANPVARGIHFPVEPEACRVEIHLAILFGCTDLSYEVQPESEGVLEFSVIPERGVLLLWPKESGKSSRSTRVVVHASTVDGVSAEISFEVRISATRSEVA